MFFLDGDGVLRHKEYLNTLKLKYAVFEKSYPFTSGMDYARLKKCSIPSAERAQLLSLFCKIRLHEIYFNSFSDCEHIKSPLEKVRRYNENALYYEIFTKGRDMESGFISLVNDRGNIRVCCESDYERHFVYGEPCLAIDMYEHAYFSDFAYMREEYLKKAVSFLNLELLN